MNNLQLPGKSISSVSLILVFATLLLFLAWSGHTETQAKKNQTTETVTTSEPRALSGEIAYIGLDSSGNALTINRIKPDRTGQQIVWIHPSSSPAGNTMYDVAWKPDGTEIAFSSNHETGYSAFNSDVYSMLSDGSNLRRITNPPSAAELEAGDYQFGTVTGQVYNNYGHITLLYVYGEGAKEPVAVDIGDFGTTVNFTIPDVADLGTGLHTVTLIWSDENCANGIEYTAAVVDVVAGETHDAGTLQFNGQCGTYNSNHITWKGDGSQLGVDVIAPRKFDAAGEALGTDLFASDATFATFASDIAWSPTDDRILYRKWVLGGSENGVYMASVGGSTESLLVTEGVSTLYVTPAWLPDGSGCVIAADHALYNYDLSTNQMTTILDFGLDGDFILNPSVSPDGNYVVFERYTSASSQYDLWIVNRTNPGELVALTSDGRSTNPDWSRIEPSTPIPTETPTNAPLETPTSIPTETPTNAPLETPTSIPTETPADVPTETPGGVPTEVPGETPTAGPEETPTTEPQPTSTAEPQPALDLNYSIGKPGSKFVLSGSNFEGMTNISIAVNGVSLLPEISISDEGFTVVLLTNGSADQGVYRVTASGAALAQDDIIATTQYILENGVEVPDPPGELLEVPVPETIEPMDLQSLYLPLVKR